MKNLIVLFLMLNSYSSSAQPNPKERYPERIKAITEQLKTDSLNYRLIWERLEMKVDLMGGFGSPDEIFSIKVDSTNKAKRRKLYFDELSIDFNKIYDNIIKLKHYDIVEEGDFYLTRTLFYLNLLEIDKAISDAKYLRDSASYSRYSERGDYYNNWALYSLFNLHVVNNQFTEALEAIDTLLKKKKTDNPEVYFSGHGSFLGYNDKVMLFNHFNKQDKIIPFLKENCKEHFKWYFENAKQNDYYSEIAKEYSFESLKRIIEYMRKFNDKELPKYDKIYKKLLYQLDENHETINPNISNKKLKSIVSKIK